MKSSILSLIFSVLFFQFACAEELKIESKNISIDKEKQITIFQDEVMCRYAQSNYFVQEYF